MNIYPFFVWCENTSVAGAIRDSVWIFPVIEAFHLLGLAVIGGCVLIVNMRLLGLGLSHQPVAQLDRDIRPIMLGSLCVMLVSGFLLFMSEATKCYEHGAFWLKMACLALAIIFTFTAQRKVIEIDERRRGSAQAKAAGVVSILLWAGVGIGGRWIGFS